MEFYVYEHWRPDTGVCFYVGKGSARRAWEVDKGRNRYHRRISGKLARTGLMVGVKIIAEGLTEDRAFALEIERIAFWRSLGVALTNKTDGGDGPSGHVHTEETRAKMSASRMGNKSTLGYRQSQETIDKRRAKLIGKRHTAEARARMSAVQKGRIVSDETRAKLSAAARNRKISPEHRAKMTAALERGRAKANGPKSLETRSRISASLTGKRLSEETKAKLSSAAKEQWQRQSRQPSLT